MRSLFRQPPVLLASVALLVIVVLLLLLVGRPLATEDLWFHLKMGEVYLTQGLWPATDPMFTMCPALRAIIPGSSARVT